MKTTTCEKKIIHVAQGAPSPDDPNDAGFFVSIDGQQWLGATRMPEPSDYDEIASWFATTERIGANGEKSWFRRMTFARRYITAPWGAGATILDPIEVPQ